jgi:hypothetical protein
MQKISIIVILIGLLAFTGVGLQAQQTEVQMPLSYYVASDTNGIQQVYQLVMGDEASVRQITHAENDVLTFGVAYDGLGITYISDAQLWLQPIHTEEAEALTTLSAVQFFSNPVFSQDGNYVAYADNGVWLYDLANRQSHQILPNVPLAEDGGNMTDMRLYAPETFVLGEDGTAAQLIVDIGIWEWNTVGVYDLATGELQTLEGIVHTDLLPLSDGRVLLYGNNGIAGEPTLEIASLNDINSYTTITNLLAATNATLFAEQVVEFEPGIVRVFGTALDVGSENTAFYVDVNLNTNTVGTVNIIMLPKSTTGSTVTGNLSNDGRFVPVYVDAIWTDFGTIFGALQLFDLSTGEAIDYTFPEIVGVFGWQE